MIDKATMETRDASITTAARVAMVAAVVLTIQGNTHIKVQPVEDITAIPVRLHTSETDVTMRILVGRIVEIIRVHSLGEINELTNLSNYSPIFRVSSFKL